MAERLARLAWSLATWMSELFWRASSMARFRVRETAEVVVDWGCSGGCCACALKVNGESRTTSRNEREKSGLAPDRGLFFRLVAVCLLHPQKRRQDRCTPNYS